METWVELAILLTYVENQSILEPILLCCASKCKQTNEQDSEDHLWNHIFTILCDYYQFFCFFFCQGANRTGSNYAIIGCNHSLQMVFIPLQKNL